MTYFAIVNQHNNRVRCVSKDGREYFSIRQYVPETVDEARAMHNDSPHGTGVVKLVEADEAPSAPWGCGVYEYNKYGYSPKLVRSDFDSSG
jgi:hypothetical protein